MNGNPYTSPASAAPPTGRITLTAEFILVYVLIPALPLTGIGPRWYVPAFLAAVVWIAGVGIRARWSRRGPRHRRAARDARRDLGTRRRLPPDFASIAVTFLAFAIISTVMIALIRPDLLFGAPREAPRRWLLFWFIYTVGSVAPQEALFRVVFFDRYRPLWGDRMWLALLLNAVSFSIAHAILHHPIVYALTFAGGYVFSLHWLRSRRFLSLCLLHGAYGFWLFTVGLGPVFGFPF
ncbi:MAG: CPBP family glutamic-type intramembrane protease [Spirochaetales bacterium]|nr:CPBP family glutamic-type intramembrane protease [Spirochaetales bacterium]